jgi:four helix bundle protein
MIAEPTPAPLADPTPTPTSAVPATPLYGYRGLKVWQRAMDLATAVYALARNLDEEHAELRDDLRRTAVAVPSQIAAGNSIYTRAAHVQHLSEAHGQVARLECLLQIAERLDTLASQETAPLLSLAADVGRMLRGLARALSAPPREAELVEAE